MCIEYVLPDSGGHSHFILNVCVVQTLLTALAERYHPGLFTALFGDPLVVNQKVIQMFDDF